MDAVRISKIVSNSGLCISGCQWHRAGSKLIGT
jgi:hypothetical protein